MSSAINKKHMCKCGHAHFEESWCGQKLTVLHKCLVKKCNCRIYRPIDPPSSVGQPKKESKPTPSSPLERSIVDLVILASNAARVMEALARDSAMAGALLEFSYRTKDVSFVGLELSAKFLDSAIGKVQRERIKLLKGKR